MDLLPALLLAVPLAALAAANRALTARGAVAAAAVGTAVLLGTGIAGGVVLLAFFVPSTLVSRRLEPRHRTRLDPKGNTRDAAQVLANGGAAALGALVGLASLTEGRWLLTAAFAAAAADTWATGCGTLSTAPPRLITTGVPVEPGTSGGVTLAGTMGATAGAALVGVAGWAAGLGPGASAAAVVVGIFGMLLDSVLGATLQGRFRCPACRIPSERRIHRCGSRTERTGGLSWLDNDGVNAAATLASLAVAWLGWHWLS